MVQLKNLGDDCSLYYPSGHVMAQDVPHGGVIDVPGEVAKPPTKKQLDEGAQPLPEDALIIGDRAWPTSRWELVEPKKKSADANEEN